ncbi:MAG: outer membrane beta-barrel protein [Gammaproteobacteria bacterium]|nr:outer membrane beta-barrel protein [Gammaproteobacteria bacterium]
MKYFSSLVVCIVCFFSSMCGTAAESSTDLVGPYSGVDVQSRNMHFRPGYSDTIVKNNYLQGNAYVGFRLHEWVGLEIGYQRAYQDSAKIISDGERYFDDEEIGSDRTRVKIKIAGPHMNLVGLLPIPEAPCNLTLIASLGLARLKLNIDSQFFVTPSEISPSSFTKRAWIPQVNLGVQHMINATFGIRGMLGWEKTSKFSNVPEAKRDHLKANLKNSTISSLGVFYKF